MRRRGVADTTGRVRKSRAALRTAAAQSSFLREILVRFFLVSRVADKKEDIKEARLQRRRRGRIDRRRQRGTTGGFRLPDETEFPVGAQRHFSAATCCHELPHDSLFISAIGKTREICNRRSPTFFMLATSAVLNTHAFYRDACWLVFPLIFTATSVFKSTVIVLIKIVRK